jgi:hypothetical protein
MTAIQVKALRGMLFISTSCKGMFGDPNLERSLIRNVSSTSKLIVWYYINEFCISSTCFGHSQAAVR